MSKVIAIDFDGTLVEDHYPAIGPIRKPMWNAIKKAREDGCKLILWTCRTDQWLQDAVNFCEDHGLVFDAVNDNLPETKALYGGNTRKVFADVYIDDRNGALSHSKDFIRLQPEIFDYPSLQVNIAHPKTRFCSICGREDDFNIVCPICGTRAFRYGT